MTDARPETVGDWGGQEQLAADNFNRLQQAIVDAFGPEFDGDFLPCYDPDDLAEALHEAWDAWGSDERLLTLSDEQIAAYVVRVCPIGKGQERP